MTYDTKSYYKNQYKSRQLKADLQRKNRLRFCFPSNMKGKKIVSVGSGPGVDIEFLATNNEVHAIDIGDKPLKIAESKGLIPHEMDLNKISQLPFESEYFDVVVATDILEHLFQPKKLLTEINRVLKEEGFAVLSVPNHFYWKRRLAILCGKGIVLPFHNSNEWDYFHIRFFTPQGWEKLLCEAGFTITKKLYDQFINVPRCLPHSIDRKVAKKFPGLFSMHFLCKVRK